MIATDYATGIHPDAPPSTRFSGTSPPFKRQTEYILRTKRKVLNELGLDLENIVQTSVYLTHMEDLPAVDLVWREFFGDAPPARSVIPCDDLAIGGARIEVSSISLRPDGGLARQTIHSPDAPPSPFHEPHAVKTGPYLWLSTQLAARRKRPRARGPREPGPPLAFLAGQAPDRIHIGETRTPSAAPREGASPT